MTDGERPGSNESNALINLDSLIMTIHEATTSSPRDERVRKNQLGIRTGQVVDTYMQAARQLARLDADRAPSEPASQAGAKARALVQLQADHTLPDAARAQLARETSIDRFPEIDREQEVAERVINIGECMGLLQTVEGREQAERGGTSWEVVRPRKIDSEIDYNLTNRDLEIIGEAAGFVQVATGLRDMPLGGDLTEIGTQMRRDVVEGLDRQLAADAATEAVIGFDLGLAATLYVTAQREVYPCSYTIYGAKVMPTSAQG